MSLEDVRVKIDEIDQELLRLLSERAEQVHLVGEIKRKDGLEFYAPEREEKLLRKLADINTANKSRLPEKSIRAIFREIMSAALARGGAAEDRLPRSRRLMDASGRAGEIWSQPHLSRGGGHGWRV